MKCLTNLTDLDCPEDGGTSVIAGSHKVHNTVDREAMVLAALVSFGASSCTLWAHLHLKMRLSPQKTPARPT